MYYSTSGCIVSAVCAVCNVCTVPCVLYVMHAACAARVLCTIVLGICCVVLRASWVLYALCVLCVMHVL